MIKKFFKDIFSLIASIFSNQELVTIVKRDISHLVELVMLRNFKAAAVFLMNDINAISNIDVSDIVKQAKIVGVDIHDFKLIITHVNNQLNMMPDSKITEGVKERVQDVNALIKDVLIQGNKEQK